MACLRVACGGGGCRGAGGVGVRSRKTRSGEASAMRQNGLRTGRSLDKISARGVQAGQGEDAVVALCCVCVCVWCACGVRRGTAAPAALSKLIIMPTSPFPPPLTLLTSNPPQYTTTAASNAFPTPN